MATYQTYLYKAVIEDFQLGWQIDENKTVLFHSNEYETASHAIRELNFHEPAHNNWFATMVERNEGEVTDEEIFDSSVIEFD